MSDPGLKIDLIGGNCPVQAEGTVDGQPFYFRARGEAWSMRIGGEDIIQYPLWRMDESYPGGSFAAGWMSGEEARAFIDKAVAKWRADQARPQEITTVKGGDEPTRAPGEALAKPKNVG